MFEPHSRVIPDFFCWWSSCPSSCNELTDGKPSSFYAFLCLVHQIPNVSKPSEIKGLGAGSWPLVRETNHNGLLRRPSFWGGVRFGWGVCWLAIIVFFVQITWSGIAELNKTGWWFQIFCGFTPNWGNDPIWLIFFQMGWNHQLENSFELESHVPQMKTGFRMPSWTKRWAGLTCG